MSADESKTGQLLSSPLPPPPPPAVSKPLGLGTGVEVIRLERPRTHTDSPYRSPWAAKQANPRIPKEAAADAGLAHRLVCEADVLARLNHPGIIGYRGLLVDTSRGVATSLLMQFGGRSLMEAIEERQEEGRDLESSLQCDLSKPARPFEPAFIVSMATQAAEALRYLHNEQRLMHGDLKSANLLLTDDDRLRLCDFGSALPLTSDKLEAPPGSQFKGTELWAAPEALRGDRFGHKADMWSLGMVLYELLTQDLPHGDLFRQRTADDYSRSRLVLSMSSMASSNASCEASILDDSAMSIDSLLSQRLGKRPPLPSWLLDESASDSPNPSVKLLQALVGIFNRLTEVDPDVRPSAVELLQLLTPLAGN